MAKSANIDIPRLCIAMRRNRWQTEKHRSNLREMVREYVGMRWSEEGARHPVPVNLIALFVSVVGRNLIAKNPRMMFSTFNRQARPIVAAMERINNREIEKMQLAETLQRCVTAGLFSMGLAKVALATPSDAAQFSWRLTAGEPYVDDVDLDDFVFDSHARSFDEVGFIGHRYRVPLDTVKDSKLYTRARKELEESYDQPYNVEGDERIGMLGRGYREMMTQEYTPHVDLWEVYIPRHRIVLTLADQWLAGGPTTLGQDEGLRVQRWIGPDTGPYHILGYGTVPGNAMPKAPIQDLWDLHESINRTYRKLMRTVDRVKELTLFRGQSEQAERINTANDGDAVPVDDPTQVQQSVFGGQALQELLAIATTFKDQFSWQAGNLDIMGGLSPQAKTAHQDEMLNENSSKSIKDMQDRTVNWVSRIGKSLAWYRHHNPISTYQTASSLRSLPNVQSQMRISPDMRQSISWEDMDIKVDPYSLANATPQSRLAAINQAIQQVYLPMAQIAMQQGITLDLNAYFQKIAEFTDEPDIDEIFTIRRPPPQGQTAGGSAGGGAAGAGMPAQTQRTYTRENRPSSTNQASNRNLVSSLLGVNTGGNPNGSTNGIKVKTP